MRISEQSYRPLMRYSAGVGAVGLQQKRRGRRRWFHCGLCGVYYVYIYIARGNESIPLQKRE